MYTYLQNKISLSTILKYDNITVYESLLLEDPRNPRSLVGVRTVAHERTERGPSTQNRGTAPVLFYCRPLAGGGTAAPQLRQSGRQLLGRHEEVWYSRLT